MRHERCLPGSFLAVVSFLYWVCWWVHLGGQSHRSNYGSGGPLKPYLAQPIKVNGVNYAKNYSKIRQTHSYYGN